MRRQCLERAVARATGEPLREIRRRGFNLLDLSEAADSESPERPPLVADWDVIDAKRRRLFP